MALTRCCYGANPMLLWHHRSGSARIRVDRVCDHIALSDFVAKLVLGVLTNVVAPGSARNVSLHHMSVINFKPTNAKFL